MPSGGRWEGGGMKILGGSYGFRGNGGGISRCREGVREGLEKIE